MSGMLHRADPTGQMSRQIYSRLGGLPLPGGERVGVRGIASLHRPKPLTPPLSLREREQTELVSRPRVKIERGALSS
jgi:hypothetical protein